MYKRKDLHLDKRLTWPTSVSRTRAAIRTLWSRVLRIHRKISFIRTDSPSSFKKLWMLDHTYVEMCHVKTKRLAMIVISFRRIALQWPIRIICKCDRVVCDYLGINYREVETCSNIGGGGPLRCWSFAFV